MWTNKSCNSSLPHFRADYKRILEGVPAQDIAKEYKNPSMFLKSIKKFASSKKGTDAYKVVELKKHLTENHNKVLCEIVAGFTEYDLSWLSNEFQLAPQKIVMLVMQLDGGDFTERLKQRRKILASRWYYANKHNLNNQEIIKDSHLSDLLRKPWT